MMNMNKEMVIVAGGAILLTTAAVVVGVRKFRKGKKAEITTVGEEIKEEEIQIKEEKEA